MALRERPGSRGGAPGLPGGVAAPAGAALPGVSRTDSSLGSGGLSSLRHDGLCPGSVGRSGLAVRRPRSGRSVSAGPGPAGRFWASSGAEARRDHPGTGADPSSPLPQRPRVPPPAASADGCPLGAVRSRSVRVGRHPPPCGRVVGSGVGLVRRVPPGGVVVALHGGARDAAAGMLEVTAAVTARVVACLPALARGGRPPDLIGKMHHAHPRFGAPRPTGADSGHAVRARVPPTRRHAERAPVPPSTPARRVLRDRRPTPPPVPGSASPRPPAPSRRGGATAAVVSGIGGRCVRRCGWGEGVAAVQ